MSTRKILLITISLPQSHCKKNFIVFSEDFPGAVDLYTKKDLRWMLFATKMLFMHHGFGTTNQRSIPFSRVLSIQCQGWSKILGHLYKLHCDHWPRDVQSSQKSIPAIEGGNHSPFFSAKQWIFNTAYVYIYMCVCVSIYMCVYLYIKIFVYTYMCLYIYICVYIYMCVCVHMWICMYMYVYYMYVYICVYICEYVCICMYIICMYMYVCRVVSITAESEDQ